MLYNKIIETETDRKPKGNDQFMRKSIIKERERS